MEIQPTGDVTEYTATIAYKLLTEGKGRQVDSLKMTLKAEGMDALLLYMHIYLMYSMYAQFLN